MKTRISITIDAAILARIDELIGTSFSRSAYIEKVLKDHFQKLEREALNRRDIELINANAYYLNREAEDVLRYQADMFEILESQANTQ
jgi:metal-responsive CopG/Arc/MetJ family transcriptional regulator